MFIGLYCLAVDEPDVTLVAPVAGFEWSNCELYEGVVQIKTFDTALEAQIWMDALVRENEESDRLMAE